jgi:hypothetical protein
MVMGASSCFWSPTIGHFDIKMRYHKDVQEPINMGFLIERANSRLAVDAVWPNYSPLPNSLFNREKTGNFRVSGHFRRRRF